MKNKVFILLFVLSIKHSYTGFEKIKEVFSKININKGMQIIKNPKIFLPVFGLVAFQAEQWRHQRPNTLAYHEKKTAINKNKSEGCISATEHFEKLLKNRSKKPLSFLAYVPGIKFIYLTKRVIQNSCKDKKLQGPLIKTLSYYEGRRFYGQKTELGLLIAELCLTWFLGKEIIKNSAL